MNLFTLFCLDNNTSTIVCINEHRSIRAGSIFSTVSFLGTGIYLCTIIWVGLHCSHIGLNTLHCLFVSTIFNEGAYLTYSKSSIRPSKMIFLLFEILRI